jgi:hypothetical protein
MKKIQAEIREEKSNKSRKWLMHDTNNEYNSMSVIQSSRNSLTSIITADAMHNKNDLDEECDNTSYGQKYIEGHSEETEHFFDSAPNMNGDTCNSEVRYQKKSNISINSESDNGCDNVNLGYNKIQDEDNNMEQSVTKIINADESNHVDNMLDQHNVGQNELSSNETCSASESSPSSLEEDNDSLSSSESCNSYTSTNSEEEDEIDNSYENSKMEESVPSLITELDDDNDEDDEDALSSASEMKRTAKKRKLLEENCSTSDTYNEVKDHNEKRIALNNRETSIVDIFNDEQELLGEVYMPSPISDPTPHMINGIDDADMPVPLPLRQREADTVSQTKSDLNTPIMSPFWTSSSSCLINDAQTPYVVTSADIWSQPQTSTACDKILPPNNQPSNHYSCPPSNPNRSKLECSTNSSPYAFSSSSFPNMTVTPTSSINNTDNNCVLFENNWSWSSSPSGSESMNTISENGKYSSSVTFSNPIPCNNSRLSSFISPLNSGCARSTMTNICSVSETKPTTHPNAFPSLSECVEEDWFVQNSESSCIQIQEQANMPYQKDRFSQNKWHRDSNSQYFVPTSNSNMTDTTNTIDPNIVYREESSPAISIKSTCDKNGVSSQLHQTSDSLLSETSPAGSPESQTSDSGSATSELSNDSTNSSRSSDEDSVYIPHDRDRSITCGQSSLFGELQSVVFNSLITSLES